ncbi:hypothetical protein [Fusobacterium varium]|uniref:hypothetical protein n=1 Tax=Fusobacterium varium TaxID=856 RepID=UPI0027DB9C79|nr:hypothetical protein [uncultured Fusobacterium sp.]
MEGWSPARIYLNEHVEKLKAEGKLPSKQKKKEILTDKSLHNGKSGTLKIYGQNIKIDESKIK